MARYNCWNGRSKHRKKTALFLSVHAFHPWVNGLVFVEYVQQCTDSSFIIINQHFNDHSLWFLSSYGLYTLCDLNFSISHMGCLAAFNTRSFVTWMRCIVHMPACIYVCIYWRPETVVQLTHIAFPVQ